MSRPEPKIILSKTTDDYVVCEILEVASLYAVVYNDKIFSMRNTFPNMLRKTTKYPKYVYPTKKVADNLAAKLNKQFNTTDFKVIKII
jgi:hypothetical protein